MTSSWRTSDGRSESARLYAIRDGGGRRWAARSKALGLRRRKRGESARRLSVAGVGEGVPGPVSIRHDLYMGLCPERHAHVPAAWVRAKRHPATQRTELRSRPLW